MPGWMWWNVDVVVICMGPRWLLTMSAAVVVDAFWSEHGSGRAYCSSQYAVRCEVSFDVGETTAAVENEPCQMGTW